MRSKLFLGIISLLIILSASACDQSAVASTSGTYAVDAAFSDFYRGIGGETILGPAISPSFTKEGIEYQYVVAGLLVYDPNQVPLTRFRFSSIASVQWKISDLVEPAPINTELPYVNGHKIWEEVWPLYQRFSSNIIGAPLTGVKANDAKQRYEQYFDGLGFFRNYSDPVGEVHLMPYGSWMCGKNCQYQETDNIPPSASYARDYSEIEQIFLQFSEKLGYGYTGLPLAAPDKAGDGSYEMAFENAILYMDPANRNQIRLRPLPSWLGVQTDEPSSEIKKDWLTFLESHDGLGYNIPVLFSKYINDHGGIIYSGDPITEYRILPDSGYTQCFANLCLEYHPTAPDSLRLRPHAMGEEYLNNGSTPITPDASIADALQIHAVEQYPLIPSGQKQSINIEATQNDAPVQNVELSLIVKQPDGITKTYTLDPTDGEGKTTIELDAINGPNGAIVQYDICILGSATPKICFSRSYTIWGK